VKAAASWRGTVMVVSVRVRRLPGALNVAPTSCERLARSSTLERSGRLDREASSGSGICTTAVASKGSLAAPKKKRRYCPLAAVYLQLSHF